MSISHWGIFPGYWISVSADPDIPITGSVVAQWMPCSFEELIIWQ